MIIVSKLELTGQVRSMESSNNNLLENILESVQGENSSARFFTNLPIASLPCGDTEELFTTEGQGVIESLLTIENAEITAPQGEIEIERQADGGISISCGFDFGVIFTEKQAHELLTAMKAFVTTASS